MSLQNLETDLFKELMQDHILKVIEYMFNTNQEFGIACELADVNFTPNLPEDLQNALPDVTLFMLANYSFESATVDTNNLTFEAGFGSDNIGAVVEIPLLAIKQLFVDEYPILMNVSSPKKEKKQEQEADPQTNSMNALLNNPENAKLLKKNKK